MSIVHLKLDIMDTYIIIIVSNLSSLEQLKCYIVRIGAPIVAIRYHSKISVHLKIIAKLYRIGQNLDYARKAPKFIKFFTTSFPTLTSLQLSTDKIYTTAWNTFKINYKLSLQLQNKVLKKAHQEMLKKHISRDQSSSCFASL